MRKVLGTLLVGGVAVIGTGLGGSAARANSTCATSSSSTVSVAQTDGGVQICSNAPVLKGTVTVTPSYAAVDGQVSNMEPADGYVGVSSGGVAVCASGEYNPGGNNPSIVSPADPVPDPNGPCTPRTAG